MREIEFRSVLSVRISRSSVAMRSSIWTRRASSTLGLPSLEEVLVFCFVPSQHIELQMDTSPRLHLRGFAVEDEERFAMGKVMG